MIIFNSKTQILIIVFVNVVWAQMDTEETKGQLKQSFVSLLKNIVDVNEKRMSAMKKLNNLQDFLLTKNSLAKIHGLDIDEDDSTEVLRNQHAILTLVDMSNNLAIRRTYNKRQAAENSNINIIIPMNSFNIKSKYINNENNRIDNSNNYNGNVDENNNEKENKDNNNLDNKRYVNHKTGDLNNIKDFNDQMDIRDEDYNQKFKQTDSEIGSRKNLRSSCNKQAVKTCRNACVDAHKNGCMIYKCSRQAKKAFSKECKRSCIDQFLSGRRGGFAVSAALGPKPSAAPFSASTIYCPTVVAAPKSGRPRPGPTVP